MPTTVYLIRHGVTDWHRERRVLGQRDIALNAVGQAQAQAAAAALGRAPVGEVITSPLMRAVQTAEVIGAAVGIEVARDPRLIDFRVGRWEGQSYDDVARSPEYQRFVADPLSERIPGGESLAEVRQRAVAAIDQALADSPSGEGIAVVTHAGTIRVLLAHYLGSNPANYHRIRVGPGSISVLSFADDRELPRILAVNWLGTLDEVIQWQSS